MFGEMVPSGSSKSTSIRESAARESVAGAHGLFEISKSPAAPFVPCCKKSRRFIIAVSVVASASYLCRDSQPPKFSAEGIQRETLRLLFLIGGHRPPRRREATRLSM